MFMVSSSHRAQSLSLSAALLGMVLSTAHAGTCTPTWDGSIGQPGASSGIVFDFAAHDDGSGGGTRLYASGNFTSIGGVSANRIARWTGSAWQPLGTGLSNSEAYAIESFGGNLYAAGYFDQAGGVAGTAKLARWNGSSWESVGAQLELFSNQLWDLLTWDDGNGEALYIVGNYQDVGGVSGASFISKWDGTNFSALGAPIGGAVPLIIFTAHVWDDGNGEALYVGGRFLTIDGVPANRIAKWDGTSWSALGTGISGPVASSSVNAMASFDDGSGEALYVAGQAFNTAGGVPATRVARWDGSTWSAVGNGFADGIVWGLRVFDDGNGPALYATGTFTLSGSDTLLRAARWNGTEWEALPGGGANGATYRTIVFDDGTGDALYVGGAYTEIGGVAANRVARLYACDHGGTGIPGDLNDDGVVDINDLLILLANWGDCPVIDDCPADLNGDGTVDINDLLTLLANWG